MTCYWILTILGGGVGGCGEANTFLIYFFPLVVQRKECFILRYCCFSQGNIHNSEEELLNSLTGLKNKTRCLEIT